MHVLPTFPYFSRGSNECVRIWSMYSILPFQSLIIIHELFMSFPISIILNINIISNDLSLLSRIYIKKKYDATVAQNESVSLFNIFSGANIVFESRRRHAGLVFQNLAFSGWVSHNTRALYLEISCRNDVTNLWLSFSIPTKKCVKAQTDPYSQFIYPYIAICKVSLKTVSEECL